MLPENLSNLFIIRGFLFLLYVPLIKRRWQLGKERLRLVASSIYREAQ